jgi:hypothetical protein
MTLPMTPPEGWVRTLPSSFSRFVSEEDLNRVRDDFLSALAELEAEDFDDDEVPLADGAEPGPHPQAGARSADAS